MNRKIIRCAIYTRKSSEEGLEQDFNSLDAQREAGEAYIKSQKHEGWELIDTKYDDGGYSGGNMDRPALKKLLADIQAGKIDVVVVYKVDRLSRALNDFAKIVDVFDKQNVSFVSVTQQFNTTTSMGRLTLNMLLSFAQFEREVTGERIRDKIAASKKKGMWMGGFVPLGYICQDRKLLIEPAEAEIVKYIFKKYAERADNETLPGLLDELKAKGYRNKSWVTEAGKHCGGKDFKLNKIYSLLNNQFYIGRIKHKDKIYDGQHKAIISQELWDKVQSKMNKFTIIKTQNHNDERPKLYGKLYDYHGNLMTSSYSYKYSKAGRYKMKYYINREIYKNGKTNSEFKRIRSDHIDVIVMEVTSTVLNELIAGISKSKNPELATMILKQLQAIKLTPAAFLSKIILFPQHLELLMVLDIKDQLLSEPALSEVSQVLSSDSEVTTSTEYIMKIKSNIPISYRRLGGKLCIIKDGIESEEGIEAQGCYPEDKTFIFIAKSFYWNRQVKQGVHKYSRHISALDNHSVEYVKRSLLQRYLSPKILEEITSSKNAKQIGVDQLMNFNHWCWEEQEKALLN